MIRMLAFVPGGISDQVLFFPTLDDLKQNYPQAQVDVVVQPQAKSVYQICKHVDRVLTFNFDGRNGLADWGNLLGSVRERQYDVGLASDQRWGIDAVLWLTGIPTRIGYSGNAVSELLLTDVIPLKTEQYLAHRNHDLLQGLGITTPCPELTINVPQSAIKWAEAEQKRLGLLGSQGSNYVLIYGGSSWSAQSNGMDQPYPVENWQKILQDFQQRQPDLPVVVIQGPTDQEWVTALKRVDPDLKVASPDDIGKLAAMIAGASLMVCINSALVPLAVAVQTYLVALFGSTDPAKLLPEADRFIGLKSPNGQIADISPATVLERVWGA